MSDWSHFGELVSSNQVDIVISAEALRGKTTLALVLFNLLQDAGFQDVDVEDLDLDNADIRLGIENYESLVALAKKDLKVRIKTVQKPRT